MRINIWSIVITFLLLLITTGCDEPGPAGNANSENTGRNSTTPEKSIYDFTVTDIHGDQVSLAKYKGQPLMIVNVASKCGATPQYEQLQQIYSKYRERGFYVLGFPANNFASQEPGTNQQIMEFCTSKYNVTFPMFARISVKGEDIAPLYKYLTTANTNQDFNGPVTWNFNKFLIGRDGRVINRFATRTKPDAPEVINAIEKTL